MSRTISGAGPHGSVDGSDRIPASKGPFDPGAAGYHTASQMAAFTLTSGSSPLFEEGTWTPQFTFATPGDLSVSYVAADGMYQRVGSLVTLIFRCLPVPVFTTSSGAARVTGLPFPASPSAFAINEPILCDGGPTLPPSGVTDYAAFVAPAATFFEIGMRGLGFSPTPLGATNISSGNGIFIRGSLRYMV